MSVSESLEAYLRDLQLGNIALVKKEKFFNGSYTEEKDIVLPLSEIWVEGFKRTIEEEIKQNQPIFGIVEPILPSTLENIVALPQLATATYTDLIKLNNGDFFLSSLDSELLKFTNNFNSMIRYGIYDDTLSTPESYAKVINVAVNPSETQIALTMGDTVQKIKIYSLPTFEYVREITDSEDLVGVAFRTDDELYYATTNKVVYDYIDTTTGTRDKKTLLEYGVNGFPSNLGVEDVKKIKVINGSLWVSDSRDRLSVFNHILDITNGHTLTFSGVTYNLLGKLFADGNADIIDFVVSESSLFLLCEQDSKIYRINVDTHEIINSIGNKTFLNYTDSLSRVKINEWHNPISFYVDVDENEAIVLDLGAKAILRGVLNNMIEVQYNLPITPTIQANVRIWDGVACIYTPIDGGNLVKRDININDRICPIFITYQSVTDDSIIPTCESETNIGTINTVVPTILGEKL